MPAQWERLQVQEDENDGYDLPEHGGCRTLREETEGRRESAHVY